MNFNGCAVAWMGSSRVGWLNGLIQISCDFTCMLCFNLAGHLFHTGPWLITQHQWHFITDFHVRTNPPTNCEPCSTHFLSTDDLLQPLSDYHGTDWQKFSDVSPILTVVSSPVLTITTDRQDILCGCLHNYVWGNITGNRIIYQAKMSAYIKCMWGRGRHLEPW